MEQSCRAIGQTTNEHVVLMELQSRQKETKEGTPSWYSLQEQINQIIANNFLQYVNR